MDPQVRSDLITIASNTGADLIMDKVVKPLTRAAAKKALQGVKDANTAFYDIAPKIYTKAFWGLSVKEQIKLMPASVFKKKLADLGPKYSRTPRKFKKYAGRKRRFKRRKRRKRPYRKRRYRRRYRR